MNKIYVLTILCFLFIATGQAQNVFSEQNLKTSSQEELEIYFSQAKKQKKAGGILLIAAPVSLGTGLLLWTNAWKGGSEDQLSLGSLMLIGSCGAAIVGIPLRITGSKRVKRVSEAWNSMNNNTQIILEPSLFNSITTQNIHSGVSLKITF